MISITYTRCRIKIRARGELPPADARTCLFTQDDHAVITYKDGSLRVKGVDIDLEVFAVKSVQIETQNSVA